MSPGAGHGCAYGVVACNDTQCKRKELCPAGVRVYRNRWTSAGHHHVNDLGRQTDDDDGTAT